MRDSLLRVLREHTSRRGLSLAREETLLAALDCDRGALAAALRELELVGEIETLVPLPFLVTRMRSWPRAFPAVSVNTMEHEPASRSAPDVPSVSSGGTAASASPIAGGTEVEDQPLRDVIAQLGDEASAEELRALITPYSHTLVRRCLQRVAATKHIRVSRLALFRSLLKRLSH